VNYDALFDRILSRIDHDTYLAATNAVDGAHSQALRELEVRRKQPGVTPQELRALINTMYKQGRLDDIRRYSALHVIAASPMVADYDEAAAMVSAQEMAVLKTGGPRLQANLASVERHRGVLAFLLQRYEIALDYFSRAFERQHNAMNLSNVLSTLIRLGEHDEAVALLTQVRSAFPRPLVEELDHLIQTDSDLIPLRKEASP